MARHTKPSEKKGNDLAAKAQPFLECIERLDAEKATEKGTFMERCKALNDDVKNVYTEAKEAGIVVKALKGLVKRRRLEKKIDAIDDGFDLDEKAQFEALAIAFAGTPFGEHARARADASRSPQQADGSEGATEARPDEENLARIGRGRGEDIVDQLAH